MVYLGLSLQTIQVAFVVSSVLCVLGILKPVVSQFHPVNVRLNHLLLHDIQDPASSSVLP